MGGREFQSAVVITLPVDDALGVQVAETHPVEPPLLPLCPGLCRDTIIIRHLCQDPGRPFDERSDEGLFHERHEIRAIHVDIFPEVGIEVVRDRRLPIAHGPDVERARKELSCKEVDDGTNVATIGRFLQSALVKRPVLQRILREKLADFLPELYPTLVESCKSLKILCRATGMSFLEKLVAHLIPYRCSPHPIASKLPLHLSNARE